ncbi:GIY-YIG nuclease family protein [Streptomyces sp. NPDC046931]|uniref:GIY-YIG nuclease family protein n=1 Tax=Streptomyces sp. NPDC046931 TaxID=3154806 RepID=UPI0033D8D84D
MTNHLEVVPEFKDTLDRPAWWFKEQWLWSRTDWSKVRKPMTEEFRRWAYAREGIPYPEDAQPAPEHGQPAPVAAPPRPPKPKATAPKPHTYLVAADGTHLVKIGIAKDPMRRLKEHQTGQPMELHLLWSVAGNYESDLHVHFAAYRVRGEWFDLTSLGDPIDVVKQAVGEIEVSRA